MSTIARSAAFSSRVLTASSVSDAVALYQAAEATPRTSTRVLLQQQGIFVDGDMAVPGAQTALFFHAFGQAPPCAEGAMWRPWQGRARVRSLL